MSMELDHIPIIDLSLHPSEELTRRVRDACVRAGFFYVTNHGVDDKIVSDAFLASRVFFEMCPSEARPPAHLNPLWRGHLGLDDAGDTCADGREDDDGDGDRGGDGPPGDGGDGSERRADDVDAALSDEVRRRRGNNARELKESFVMGAEGGPGRSPMHGPNVWPDEGRFPPAARALMEENGVTSFRVAMERYWCAVLALSRRLSRVLGLSLGLDEGYLEGALTDPCAQMVLLRYPLGRRRQAGQPPPSAADGGTCPAVVEEDGPVGCGAHTDCGFLTILAQDLPGLEVYSKVDGGRWIQAPPVDGTFVVNLGDMLEFWSGGRYLSTRHRVVEASRPEVGAPGREDETARDARYSIPFFCNCDYYAPLEDLRELSRAAEKGTYEKQDEKAENVMTAGEYVSKKLGLMRV